MKKVFYILICAYFFPVVSRAESHHPYIFYTNERIAEAKRQMKSDTALVRCWNEILNYADRNIRSRDISKCDYLSLAYRMTGQQKYAETVKGMLLNITKASTWGSTEMQLRKPVWTADLGLGHRCFMSAVGYDAIYDILTLKERRDIAQSLYHLGVEPSYGDWIADSTRIHTLNSMGHNWWTCCVGMGGILALSIEKEVPQAGVVATRINQVLPQWFSFGGDELQHKPKTFDDGAGGMYESLNYANFGITEALLFRVAWKNAHPDKTVSDIPQLKRLSGFFCHTCYPHNGPLESINFGDGNLQITGESSLMLLWYLGIKDDNMLWYMSQVKEGQNREGFFRNRPMGFLYTPDLRGTKPEPQLEKNCIWNSFGWATMRDSWKKDASMLAVKSGYTWNHSHADANSFILFHHGVDIIKDCGNCNYQRPEYRQFFFQSDAHNVVLIDGEGQPVEQEYYGAPLRGYLYHMMDNGSMKYLLADGTGPMASKLSRNFRHFLWMDKVIFIVDDLKSHAPSTYEWLWHTNGKAKKQGGDLLVDSAGSSVIIRPLYPQTLAPSDFVQDYPENLYMTEKTAPTPYLQHDETYYSFHLPGKQSTVKGVAAILLKDSSDDKDLPQIERRSGENWIGLRISFRGKVTDLYINQLADGRLMHSNSWIEADGWTTDAYMMAVTYNQGSNPADATDFFVCYGSSIRRGGKSYYSSLSKLFVMKKGNHVDVDGQVMVDAAFQGKKIKR